MILMNDFNRDWAYVRVYLAHLSLSSLASWFRQFANLMVDSDHREIKDRDYLRFTLLKQDESERYQVLQGIFCQQYGKVYDARVIESISVDSTILNIHDYGKKQLVVWN